jgi:membrane-associated phospholipid phosphatase
MRLRPRPRLAASLLAFAGALVSPALARADDPAPAPHASPYRFQLMLDLPIIGLGAAGATAAFVPRTVPTCLPDCRAPDSLNGLDSRALGYYSPAAHTAADILVYTLLLAPHAVNLVATRGRDGAWLEDLVISAESVLLTQGLTQVVKVAVSRPAPIVFDSDVPLDERKGNDALASFWSGHTATAFSAATSFAVSYWLRHPHDPWRWVVLATLESAALVTGMLKIRAGYHYPTDIFAGAAAGISIGVLVPMLHARFD